MDRQTIVAVLMLVVSNAAFAGDFEALFGIVPGERIPYLKSEFGQSPNNIYEKPVQGRQLAEFFQHIQVIVLPPDTVANFYAVRAYRGPVQCLEDMASINQILMPLFPDSEEGNAYQRVSADGGVRLSLGCGTDGRTPFYTLRMHVSHIESTSELTRQIFGPAG